MRNETILKKVYQKAVKNGYKPIFSIRGLIGGRNRHSFWYYSIIFDKDFAKAFWYEELADRSWLLNDSIWRFYLTHMVLEKDPIKYLEKFI